jgi:preprotein translocase subunit SecA
MFGEMLGNIKSDIIGILSRVQIRTQQDLELAEKKPEPQQLTYNHPAAPNALTGETGGEGGAAREPFIRKERKIGRNEPCPCGSGKKYKHCHGKLS